QAEVPVLTLVLVVWGGPRPYHDLFGLEESFISLLGIDAITLIVVDVESGATAQSDHEPSLADVVDQGHLLGQPDGMVQRHLCNRESDADLFRARCQRGCKTHGIHVGTDAVKVMLRQPQPFHAQRVAKACFAQRLLDDLLVLGGVHRRWKKESAEFHVRPCGCCSAADVECGSTKLKRMTEPG